MWSRCMRARGEGSSPGRVEGSSRAMLATARPYCSFLYARYVTGNLFSRLYIGPVMSLTGRVVKFWQLELLGSAQSGSSSTERLSRRVASPMKGHGRMTFKPLRRDASVGDTQAQQSPSGERNDAKPVCLLGKCYVGKGMSRHSTLETFMSKFYFEIQITLLPLCGLFACSPAFRKK